MHQSQGGNYNVLLDPVSPATALCSVDRTFGQGNRFSDQNEITIEAYG